MTEGEVRDIMYRNRDLVEQPGSIIELEDYNVESLAPPTLSGVDNDLHQFGEEFSNSFSNLDKHYQYESPSNTIVSNPDTGLLHPSNSQTSTSSSHLTSISRRRQKIPYNVPHHIQEEIIPPLPSGWIS